MFDKIMKTTKEKAEIMLAFDRGEQIQFYDTICKRWIDIISEPNWCWSLHDYRIKPKPKFVPFETAEEFLKAQRKHGGVLFDVKTKTFCNSFVSEGGMICTKHKDSFKICSLQDAFENYKFYNGAPCGKEVNV